MALIKQVKGKTPTFGKNCYLSENATVVGDVVTGNDCSIWFNAVVRGDVHFIKLGNKVLEYKKNLIKNQIQNVDLKIECIEGNKFIELSSNEKDFDVIYPSVGENMSFLKRIMKKNNLMINYLIRDEDKYCWQFSNKGYFNFRSNIPKILSQFKLN